MEDPQLNIKYTYTIILAQSWLFCPLLVTNQISATLLRAVTDPTKVVLIMSQYVRPTSLHCLIAELTDIHTSQRYITLVPAPSITCWCSLRLGSTAGSHRCRRSSRPSGCRCCPCCWPAPGRFRRRSRRCAPRRCGRSRCPTPPLRCCPPPGAGAPPPAARTWPTEMWNDRFLVYLQQTTEGLGPEHD